MKDGGARATSSAEVHSFLNEGEMFRAVRDSLVACNADIITRYNIVGFDIPYRIKRAE